MGSDKKGHAVWMHDDDYHRLLRLRHKYECETRASTLSLAITALEQWADAQTTYRRVDA